MSKSGKIRKRLAKFVGGLSNEECREQLLLSYLQMERCQQLLRGEDVEPVDMKDNGMSSDLELFYACKKVREELDSFDEEEEEDFPDMRISVIVSNYTDALRDYVNGVRR